MLKFSVPVLVAASVLFAPLSAADLKTAEALRDKALTDKTAWSVLESLTTEIGARPIGSANYDRAKDWAVNKLKDLGFTDIKVESFEKDTWQRGPESAEVIAPFPQKLALIGLGGSVPTPKKGIEAEIVVLKHFSQLLSAPEGAFKGKIVVINQPMPRAEDGSGYGATVRIRYGDGEAAKRGAVAYLIRSVSTSTNRTPHTGSGVAEAAGSGPHIPVAALGVPDADQLERMAAKGPVRIRLNMASTIRPHSPLWNISGEIKGSEKPDEVIVIGGHLDSWDPGTGAIDDGSGVAITAAAAHLIDQLPKHPKRTIRVVFFGSEENGGSSEAYAAAHKTEVAKIVATSESDSGPDRVLKLELPGEAAKAPELSSLPLALLPLKIMLLPTPSRHAGADVTGLIEAGVPPFALHNDSSRYFDYHHTADDTLAIVDPAQLNQNVAAWATVLYYLADSDLDFRSKTGK